MISFSNLTGGLPPVPGTGGVIPSSQPGTIVVPDPTHGVFTPLNAISTYNIDPYKNTLPSPTGDGGNARLNVVLPRSTMSERGIVAGIRLKANPSISRASRQSNINGVSLKAGLDALLNTSYYFQNFLLTDVAVSFDEKVQVMTTFGDNEVAYYFGRQPVIYNFRGLLVDSIDFAWFTEFIGLYTTVLRGSALAKNYELLEIMLPNMKVVGSIMSLETNQSAARDTDIPFSMKFLVKQFTPLVMPTTSNFNNSNLPTLSFAASSVPSIANQVAALYGGIPGAGNFLTSYGQVASGGTSNQTPMTFGGGSSWSPTTSVGSGLVTSIASSLNSLSSFAASTFSPVYGILASITSVVTSSGISLQSIISQFTNPLQNILTTVNSVSSEAYALSNAVMAATGGILGPFLNLESSITTSLAGVQNAVGSITRIPLTISQSLAAFANLGMIANINAVLNTSGGSSSSNYSAAMGASGIIVTSGVGVSVPIPPPGQPVVANYNPILGGPPVIDLAPASKISMLSSGSTYTPQAGYSLP